MNSSSMKNNIEENDINAKFEMRGYKKMLF